MRDELSLILDTLRTPSPFGKEGPNAMETLALAAAVDPDDKFKHVVVNMRGVNGNTLVIVGLVKQALKRAGATPVEIYCFVGNALAHDYEHALATVCQWVTITDEVPRTATDAWNGFVKTATKNRKDQHDD